MNVYNLDTLHFFDNDLLCFFIKECSYCIGRAVDLFEKMQWLDVGGSPKQRNAILSGQCHNVILWIIPSPYYFCDGC